VNKTSKARVGTVGQQFRPRHRRGSLFHSLQSSVLDNMAGVV
jgi:hypothetical protein